MSAIASPSICVLMSLYNGARYLAEQIESIAAQKNVSVFLLGRDDGSSDTSARIFEETCRKLNVPSRLLTGKNLGPAQSFLDLVYQAARDFDYYSFADQDDVWLDNKLERAAQALAKSNGKPGLYVCRQYITDANLNIKGLSRIPDKVGFGNALVQNIALGAATVFNLEALKLLQSIPRPQNFLMHDWWIYLVLSSTAEITYDPCPCIYYRQHGRNVVGADTRFFDVLKRRYVNHIVNRSMVCSQQINELLRVAGSYITSGDYKLAQDLVSAKSSISARIGLSLSRSLWRQGFVDDAIWRILILLGRY